MKADAAAFADRVAKDAGKIMLALLLFFFLFFLFGETPDMEVGVKTAIQERIRTHNPFATAEVVDTIFEENPPGSFDLGVLARRGAAFPALFLFWADHALTNSLGKPLAYFEASDYPSVFEILIPRFGRTFAISLLGALFSVIVSLWVSMAYVQRTWRLGLNEGLRERSGSIFGLKALSFFSTIPACVLAGLCVYLLCGIGLWESSVCRLVMCALIVGYSDGVFTILSSYLTDILQGEFRSLYIPMAATRGARNWEPVPPSRMRRTLGGKALRHALPTVLMVFRQRISIMLGITIIVEVAFDVEGLGAKFWHLVVTNANGDYFQIMGIFIGFAAIWLALDVICWAFQLLGRSREEGCAGGSTTERRLCQGEGAA